MTHDYAEVGEYEVRISNDISSLSCSNRRADEYSDVYAPMIREVHTNATLLESLLSTCFRNARNMRVFTCRGASVRTIEATTFGGCTALAGRLDFPCVYDVAETAFCDSPDVTELHFSAANEAMIKSLPGYGTAFGAPNAEVFCDL